jgi:Rod binding domain-containing protein
MSQVLRDRLSSDLERSGGVGPAAELLRQLNRALSSHAELLLDVGITLRSTSA